MSAPDAEDFESTNQHETDRVVLDIDEAVQVADFLAGHYHHTKEDSYQPTARHAARMAMMIRDRAGHEPNPELLDDE